MEKFPSRGGHENKEPRFDFKKTLKEISDLAKEKLGPAERKHGFKGTRESDRKAAGGVEPFYVEQSDIDALPGNLHEAMSHPGPEEHEEEGYEETDPYDGE
ncbi:hypothetical protein KGO95_02905 [Patescibacteria group bacterium]|nr:hypothetical protein [Patescibacteria group bacterium]